MLRIKCRPAAGQHQAAAAAWFGGHLTDENASILEIIIMIARVRVRAARHVQKGTDARDCREKDLVIHLVARGGQRCDIIMCVRPSCVCVCPCMACVRCARSRPRNIMSMCVCMRGTG